MAFPVQRRFPCSPTSAAAARAFVAEAVAGLDLDLDALVLLTSELASNAVSHAGTAFDVIVDRTSDGVRVAVADQAPAAALLPAREPGGGFGLGIVAALADRWGSDGQASGTTVWFELPATVSAVVVAPSGGPSGERASAEPTYSIGGVSGLVGVETSTLRAWEQRYGTVVPFRSPSGRRIYSRDQVDQLRFVVAQISSGMSAADAHRLLEQRMDAVTFVPSGHRQSMLVLLAERDQFAAGLFEYFLRTEGLDVCVALDAEEAARLQQQQRPDLLILELLLPGGSAIDLCRAAVAEGIPVLTVSSMALRDAADEAGASAFLTKPIDPLQLVSTVRDLIGTSALTGSGGPRVLDGATRT
ncbi:MAG: MerR family transcriptional regulator [Acidimicrobiales bacterium]